jgi:hypothetical protein
MMTKEFLSIPQLRNEHDLVRRIELSVAILHRWRLLKEDPKYLKVGAAECPILSVTFEKESL